MSDDTPGPGQNQHEGADSANPTHREAEPSEGVSGGQVGPYRLQQKLGEGGMGEVWAAEQQSPVRRRVALKVIKRGMDTKQVIARFEAERQALALMDHPCVAKVLDAGATARGRPYFVMELVRGEPITRHCDRQRLTTGQRLRLFIHVCEGVQHAHQKGIIHRDIKPSNILVATDEKGPVPKIIDFGVAKATAQRLTERTVFTELGQLIGTPEYMSPEQAEMTAQDIDTRTDVYSLGVLLYELLVGALPFESKSLREAGFDELRRRIREDEASKPSTRLSTAGASASEFARSRRTNATALAKRLRGDLDWITMRALEKDRTRRYATPGELAADVERHLTNQPVDAGPPGALYILGKFARRNRVMVASGLAIVLALALGIVATSMALLQATRAREAEMEQRQLAEQRRERAETQAAISDAVNRFLNDDLLGAADPLRSRGRQVTVREVLDVASEKVGQAFADQPLVEARVRETLGVAYRKLGDFERSAEHLERSLALQDATDGADELETANVLIEIALTYTDLQRIEATVPLVDRAFELRRERLGPDNPLVLRTSAELEMYRALSRGEASASLNDTTLSMMAAVRGNGESIDEMRATLETMILELERLGRDGQIDAGVEHLLSESQAFLSNPFFRPQVPWSFAAQGHALLESFPFAGEVLLHAAIRLGTENPGREHEHTLLAVSHLADAYREREQFEDSERLFLENFEIGERIYGLRHPHTVNAADDLLRLYEDWGEPARADELRARYSEGE